ncbi:hypothetical protein AQZ52_11115 [Novosphingobium fuchskuhlense]|uniref:Uncharacterized protein n=1 Tax=Novosphingobium fuchskuhlense TaxID=1117702 RepID=A0A117UUS1_9SPHN|nr:hypothetical protein [Novosphingobium fuchskuhlense]KUR71213.1 hypothetical protein AQZ52_11115 [Novosphingobium fuchskuhlense]
MTHAAPLPPITAPADIMLEARTNCAARATSRGKPELADAFMRCTQDAGWAIRHEVAKLLAERAS